MGNYMRSIISVGMMCMWVQFNPMVASAESSPGTDKQKTNEESPENPNTQDNKSKAKDLISQLIDQLGSSAFEERERAAEQLLLLGRQALPKLFDARNHPDAEIAARTFELRIKLVGRGMLGIQIQETAIDHSKDAGAEEDDKESDKEEKSKEDIIPAPARVVVNSFPGMNHPVTKQRIYLPVETSGLEVGDEILSVDGIPVKGLKDLQRLVIKAGPGAMVALKIRRGDEDKLLKVRLIRNPGDPTPIINNPNEYSSGTKPPKREESVPIPRPVPVLPQPIPKNK